MNAIPSPGGRSTNGEKIMACHGMVNGILGSGESFICAGSREERLVRRWLMGTPRAVDGVHRLGASR